MNEHEPLFNDPEISVAAKAAELTQRAIEALIMEFQEVPTDVLLAIADERDRIRSDGWIQQAIREYVEAWRE